MTTTTAPASTRVAVRAQATRVRHVASLNRTTRIGWAAKVTFSDAAVVVCEHSHRTPDATRPCSARIAQAG